MYFDSFVVFSSDMYFTLKLIKAGAEPLQEEKGNRLGDPRSLDGCQRVGRC